MMYTLLIVDDEPLTREYMKLNLTSIHSNWTLAGEAEDGLDALTFLEKQRPDLVITDIKMPVMDGLELCRIITERYPEQKLIILSGYDEFEYARQAVRYNVLDYLLKPIVKEELKAALQNVINRTAHPVRNSDVPLPSGLDGLPDEDDVILKTKEYILGHYSESISLALIAENAGISAGYLSQLFHRTSGESYIQFLTKIRMRQAALLLAEYPEATLSQICERVGYMGVKHFSYAFKQHFSMTPGDYRRSRIQAGGNDTK
ncbi:MAG: response regulator [Clostridiales bacterium]|nr:response regulator [Clostridiales bacterium]